MNKRVRVLVLVCCVAAAGATARAQNPPGTPAAAQLLEVYAAAFDDDGRPVTDLKREELEVWIGGFRVPIERLVSVTPSAQERPGRLILLLLDDMTLDPAMIARARDIANRFIGRLLPGDRMGIVTLNGGATEITDDPVRLRRQLDSFRQSLGIMPIDRIGEHLLLKVGAAARAVAEAPEARKTIVAIGSGWLLDTPVPPAQVNVNLREEWFDTLRALAVANVTYHVIDPNGVGARRLASNGLAFETGGHGFTNTNDFSGAVDRILRQIDNYYVITVGDPPVGQKAALRDLDVRVLRRDVTVRARRSIPGGGR